MSCFISYVEQIKLRTEKIHLLIKVIIFILYFSRYYSPGYSEKLLDRIEHYQVPVIN